MGEIVGGLGMANSFAVQNEGLRHGSPTGLQVHCKRKKRARSLLVSRPTYISKSE